MTKYRVVTLGGRYRGIHSHALAEGTDVALCGAKPGRRAGWSPSVGHTGTVTCEKCINEGIKKIGELEFAFLAIGGLVMKEVTIDIECPACKVVNHVDVPQPAQWSDGQEEVCPECGATFTLFQSKETSRLVAIAL